MAEQNTRCACLAYPALHDRTPEDHRPFVVVSTREAEDGATEILVRPLDGQVCERAARKSEDPATSAREAADEIEAKQPERAVSA